MFYLRQTHTQAHSRGGGLDGGAPDGGGKLDDDRCVAQFSPVNPGAHGGGGDEFGGGDDGELCGGNEDDDTAVGQFGDGGSGPHTQLADVHPSLATHLHPSPHCIPRHGPPRWHTVGSGGLYE
jgi:hypothetical protein